jgi:hypothetical protein
MLEYNPPGAAEHWKNSISSCGKGSISTYRGFYMLFFPYFVTTELVPQCRDNPACVARILLGAEPELQRPFDDRYVNTEFPCRIDGPHSLSALRRGTGNGAQFPPVLFISFLEPVNESRLDDTPMVVKVGDLREIKLEIRPLLKYRER